MKYFTIAVSLAIFSASMVNAEDIVGVAKVIDGDSIEIDGLVVQLHGISSMKPGQICDKTPYWFGGKWPCGNEAKRELESMVTGRTVTCVPVDTHYPSAGHHLRAYCSAGQIDFQYWMVSAGLAMSSAGYSLRYEDIEAEAKSKRIGIWSSDFTPPYDWHEEDQ